MGLDRWFLRATWPLIAGCAVMPHRFPSEQVEVLCRHSEDEIAIDFGGGVLLCYETLAFRCDIRLSGDDAVVDGVGDFRKEGNGCPTQDHGPGTFLCKLPSGLDPEATTLVTADGRQEVRLTDLVDCADYAG
jgi:hypothetical protein